MTLAARACPVMVGLAVDTPRRFCMAAIPVTDGHFEDLDDFDGGFQVCPIDGPSYDDVPNRLGHVEPRTTERGVERYYTVHHQP